MPEALWIRPSEPRSIFRVHNWEALPVASRQILRASLPHTVGEESASELAEVICIGPAEWLVLSSPGQLSEAVMVEALGQSSFRWADISAALTGLTVTGSEARTLLGKGCGLNLHPIRFAVGRAARTRFAGMPVVVRCTQPDEFECLVTRSFGDYLSSWLADAALELE